MRKETEKNKQRYLNWKEKHGKIIPNISETNSRIILDYIKNKIIEMF